jgi:hypothetical protein
VLRPGGRLLVLEFSKIAEPLRKAYDWYSFNVLPRIGQLVAKDADSYRYLAESIRMHPDQATLKAMMKAPASATSTCTTWRRRGGAARGDQVLNDLDALRRLTTESMFDELAAQLPHRGAEPNRTDVLSVEAHLISHEAVGPLELASIEFSGMVRESAELGAMPFREVWMLARQQPESSWRLARQQALL